MAVEKYTAKTDVVVKLVLVFFISLLSFSIGTFVGKKFSDNQYRLAQLEPTTEDRGIASIPKDTLEVKPSDTLTDEEIAKLAEEFVTDDESPVMEKAPEPSTETVAEVAESSKPEVLPAAQAVAAGKAPSATAKSETQAAQIPTSLPRQIASSPAGKYTVQVAAYAEEKEAQILSANLKSKGYSAFYVPANVKGRTWYRVGIGLFNSTQDAQSYRKDLLGKSVVSSAIVQKIAAE